MLCREHAQAGRKESPAWNSGGRDRWTLLKRKVPGYWAHEKGNGRGWPHQEGPLRPPQKGCVFHSPSSRVAFSPTRDHWACGHKCFGSSAQESKPTSSEAAPEPLPIRTRLSHIYPIFSTQHSHSALVSFCKFLPFWPPEIASPCWIRGLCWKWTRKKLHEVVSGYRVPKKNQTKQSLSHV